MDSLRAGNTTCGSQRRSVSESCAIRSGLPRNPSMPIAMQRSGSPLLTLAVIAITGVRGRCVRRSALRIAADRKSTRLNSSHPSISYAVFCLKKKTNNFSSLQHMIYLSLQPVIEVSLLELDDDVG